MKTEIYCPECGELLLKTQDRSYIAYGIIYHHAEFDSAVRCFKCGTYTSLPAHVAKALKTS